MFRFRRRPAPARPDALLLALTGVRTDLQYVVDVGGTTTEWFSLPAGRRHADIQLDQLARDVTDPLLAHAVHRVATSWRDVVCLAPHPRLPRPEGWSPDHVYDRDDREVDLGLERVACAAEAGLHEVSRALLLSATA